MTADAAGVDPLPTPSGLDATLVLVRHGESTWVAEGRFQGRANVPLSAVGRRQAELVAARLARPHASPALPVPPGPPLEIVHSPIRRATETAEAIATATGCPLRAEPGLGEIGQGAWEGLTAAEIRERWADVLATWRRAPLEAWAPDGEPLPDVARRVEPALASVLGRLAAAGVEGTLDRDQVLGYGHDAADQPWSIVVGHDGVFKIALLRLFGLPLERFWTFSFALCAVTIVEFRGGRATLRAHNIAEHLAPLLDERAQEAAEARERSGAL